MAQIHPMSPSEQFSRHSVVPPPRVFTESGWIEGYKVGKVNCFLGIPYARPPVKDFRWRKPSPMYEWREILHCKDFRPRCPSLSAPFYETRERYACEDCLYMNIWAAPGKGNPVIVFIHAGSFICGSGSDKACDGGRMAYLGATVVTFNYRVGAFGFVAHPELGANFGLLDQQAALAWVRRNIHRFGGDENNVTLCGASSGAVSARWLMSTPAASWNFDRVILQSGGFDPTLSTYPCLSYDQATRLTGSLFDKLGTHDTEELRLIPMKTVKEASSLLFSEHCRNSILQIPQTFVWAPVIDGATFFDISLEHCPLHVPLMLGCNTYDAQYSIMPGQGPPKDMLARWAERYCGASSQRVIDCLEKYEGDDSDRAERFATALYFLEPCFATAFRYHDGGRRRVYLYQFNAGRSKFDGTRENAWHTVEIPFVFGNLPRFKDTYLFGDQDGRASEQMLQAWMAFARSGEPRCELVRRWAPFPNSTALFGNRVDKADLKVITELLNIMLKERGDQLFGRLEFSDLGMYEPSDDEHSSQDGEPDEMEGVE
ncbi:hypothetical protein M409DRAFT_22455 [Zasmidium cellare ATCC 36951]|uniref:Carboxylic ester hydrolase n=1 Tax=Zasmidium cellare ATCC 36951 TaxID=1080233 RepID=A0A6A6CNH4_ZASCE|nr:uncharacterized protein M409DRAFT_22455 [Zasmidium cellare ATCC 36951]KAF2167016.1 hypothetical protein M409DRAFT_22455 [Zasmidium cellare ATCC 36951]